MTAIKYSDNLDWQRSKVNLPAGQLGHWALEHFTVVEGSAAQDLMTFEGPRFVPGNYTRLVHYAAGVPDADECLEATPRLGGQVFMSDIQMEIEDHYEVMAAIRSRGGRILIHGLGLGVIVKFALEQPNVTHVDVVELDQ